MKRSKRILALLAVLAVVCVGTFVLTRHEEHVEQIQNSDEIILQVPPDDVTNLSWKNETAELSFHKDGRWIYDGDEAFPVDEEKVRTFLSRFENFGVSFAIDQVEDFSQYGLDSPVCTISFSTAENDYEVKLGDFSVMDSKRYVSIGDGKVYLVNSDPLDDFAAELPDMINQDDMPAVANADAIRFTGLENYDIYYEEESKNTWCATDVYFTDRDGKPAPLDTENVSSYLSFLRTFAPTEYVTYNATEEELAQYGLDAPDLTVEIDYVPEEDGEDAQDGASGGSDGATGESQTFVLHLARPSLGETAEEEPAAETESETANDESATDETENDERENDETATDETGEESTEDDSPAYLRVGDSPIIYQITAQDWDSLTAASYDDLRHKALMTADLSQITQIDVTLDDGEYTFLSEVQGKGEDEDRTWTYNGKELDLANFNGCLQSLVADSFLEDTPQDKQEIALTLHLENENFQEISIALYRYDGEHCLATLNGEPTSLIPRSQVVDLVEAVNAIVLE